VIRGGKFIHSVSGTSSNNWVYINRRSNIYIGHSDTTKPILCPLTRSASPTRFAYLPVIWQWFLDDTTEKPEDPNIGRLFKRPISPDFPSMTWQLWYEKIIDDTKDTLHRVSCRNFLSTTWIIYALLILKTMTAESCHWIWNKNTSMILILAGRYWEAAPNFGTYLVSCSLL
jgi:hypothetical protein